MDARGGAEREAGVRQPERVPRESIYLELLEALATSTQRRAAPAPELAKALGATPQLVVAKLQLLVTGGLVSRHEARAGYLYALSEEGREYLVRSGSKRIEG